MTMTSLTCPVCGTKLEPYPLTVHIDARGKIVTRKERAVRTEPAFECPTHGVMPQGYAIDEDNPAPDPWWNR
jgi:hypothetical protein